MQILFCPTVVAARTLESLASYNFDFGAKVRGILVT